MLWILGKMAALAAMARAATRQHERAVALEQRIDLAREVHEGVVQRLFGVSLALSGDQPFDEETRRRCAEEVQEALGDLRTAMQRPLGRSAAATQHDARARRSRACATSTPISGIELEGGDASRCPSRSSRSRSRCSPEAIRNAAKHSQRDARRRAHRGRRRHLRARGDQRRRRAPRPTARPAWDCGWPASRRSRPAACSSSARASGGRWQVRLVVPFEEP